jgi:PKD repeat protein
MCWFMRLTLAVAITTVVLVGCEGSSSEPPDPELFADPEICDVPCEVVVDSGIDATGTELTFSWDVGDGPIEGEQRFLHRFGSAGTYDITLTVTDGGQSTTDTITVQAEPQPTSSRLIDQAGGTVSQGSGSVTVPAELAPQEVTVELTELPSMHEAAERVLGPERFAALGKAYRVSMPLKTDTVIDIAVKDSEAIGKDPKNLGWLVRLVGKPVTTPSEGEQPARSRAPWVGYVVLPVTSVDEDGTAHGEIFARQQFQLVELAAPLEIESFSIEEASASPATSASSKAAAKAPSAPLPPIIVFWDSPPHLDSAKFADAIRQGVQASYEVLVKQMLFVPPRGQLKVIVSGAPDPGDVGFVDFDEPLTIYLAHKINNQELVMKVVAHEFFHLIQNANSNEASDIRYGDQDTWFAEGTADWAMDEVFDDIHNRYHAMKWFRFLTPLNTDTPKNDEEYETVGFWKWAEAYKPTIIRQIIEYKYFLTHTTPPGSSTMVENSAEADYLASQRAVWSEADFLRFVYDARYEKDFDTDETLAKELWAPHPYLGPKKTIYVDQNKTDSIADAVSGDSPSNPLRLSFVLARHLTAEAFLVKNLDMEGDLHIKFPVTTGEPLDARVVIVDANTSELEEDHIVRDLSKAHADVKVKFDPDKEALIFVADGRWLYSTNPVPTTGDIQVWMEDPCGALPHNVVDITPEDDLFVALTSAPTGSAVRLAAGTYYPPIVQWPTPEFGPFGANVLVRELTLIGAGEGQTRVVMTGDPYAGLGLKTYGNATLRNLTIDARDSEPAVDCLDAKQVTLCNVTIEASSTTDYGIIWGPWNGGSTSLSIYNSTLVHPDREHVGFGISLQSCYQPPAIVTAELSLTSVSGWGNGVSWFTGDGECGSISVTADCDGFSNNDYNVVEWVCTGGVCTANEKCP